MAPYLYSYTTYANFKAQVLSKCGYDLAADLYAIPAYKKEQTLQSISQCSAILKAYGLTAAAYDYCNGACLDMCGSDNSCSARCPAVGSLSMISNTELFEELDFSVNDPSVTRSQLKCVVRFLMQDKYTTYANFKASILRSCGVQWAQELNALTPAQKTRDLNSFSKCARLLTKYGLTNAAKSYCSGSCYDMCGTDTTCSSRCPAATSALFDTLEAFEEMIVENNPDLS